MVNKQKLDLNKQLSINFNFSKIFAYICIALFVFVILSSCSSDIKTVNIITDYSDLPDETAEDVELIISENAKIIAKVKTPILNHYINDMPYVEFPKGIIVEFLENDGKIKSKLTAGWAISKEKERIIEVKNNVIVINSKGESINTEHLIYNETTEKIYSNVFVKITRQDEIIFGEGFESDKFLNNWILRKPFGTINIKDSLLLKNE